MAPYVMDTSGKGLGSRPRSQLPRRICSRQAPIDKPLLNSTLFAPQDDHVDIRMLSIGFADEPFYCEPSRETPDEGRIPERS